MNHTLIFYMTEKLIQNQYLMKFFAVESFNFEQSLSSFSFDSMGLSNLLYNEIHFFK